LELANWARGVRPFVALDPAVLRSPSRKTEDGVGPRGENLAGFLRSIRDRSPKRFGAIVSRVQRSYPQLQGLTLRSAGYGWNRIEVQEDWGGSSVSFTAAQVSDGLLRLLAVSALQEISTPPSVLMFNEIENGLHPHLLQGLIEMLQELADGGRTQIVATTHSPIALNYVQPPSVLIVNRDQEGATSVTPLVDTRSFRSLGGHLDAGELWYNLGERELLRSARRGNASRAKR
jgi:predicted ATPase